MYNSAYNKLITTACNKQPWIMIEGLNAVYFFLSLRRHYWIIKQFFNAGKNKSQRSNCLPI